MTKNTTTQQDAVESLAHDLKSPLTVARSWVDMMQHAGPLNTEQSEALDRALNSLDRATTMINDMLALAHMNGEIRRARVDLNSILLQSLELLQSQATRHTLELRCHLPRRAVVIHADETLIKRLLDNLLHNAIKFNRDGGVVEVSVGYHGGFVRVDVRDDGPGIPIEEQPLVFDRFYRGVNHRRDKERGSGMGLAICKAIVEQHGGSIWLESAPGQGCQFSFTLPIRTESSAGQQPGSLDLMGGGEASESADGVDDDQQESAEHPDAESRHDEV